MANEIKKELIQKKLDLVVQKLMHLGAPENEDTLKEGGEAIGFFSRDFGIKEWDWPQGIGSGCGQWAANAASVTGVSVLFITMSLQTRSIRSPLWWTRSGLYPNGGSSGIPRRGQRLRTGRTCKRRIISAMRKKATKPGKTARKPAKKGQNRAAFRRSVTASGRVGRVPLPPPSATPRCPAPIYTQEVF